MIEQLAVPARAVGGFVEMSIDTFVKIFRRPFQFREFLEQTSVMVYLNRTVTDKSKNPVYDGSRLKVDYVKVDGQWLINYITPI